MISAVILRFLGGPMDSAHALLSSSEGGIFPKPREKYALSMAGVLRGSIEEGHIGNRVSLSSVLCLPAVILRFLGGSMYSAYALQGSSLGETFPKPREKYALSMTGYLRTNKRNFIYE